ncbi:MAG TPA: hypothetical protein VHN18_12135 [Micromonosporaceae bacterium]|nr:hypothetical protein [Micromonosporaceae bacterium]
MSGHGLAGATDAGAFLARLIQLDPTAVVRLRTGADDLTTVWARLPWSPLVCRTVTGPGPGDATVTAADLLAELDRSGDRLPNRRDADWRWPLPPDRGARVVERIPAADVLRIAASAASALRSASTEGVAGRAVGERQLRDALLDHVAIEVTEEGAGPQTRVEVSQRLVQAVVRMGFLGQPDRGTDDQVLVRTAGRWVGLSGSYGSAWLPRGKQLVIQTGRRPNG